MDPIIGLVRPDLLHTTDATLAKIAAGFPQTGDRYSHSTCELDPQATRMAAILEHSPHHSPPVWVKDLMQTTVRALYARMLMRGIKVVTCLGEPYLTSEDMQRDVRDNKRMFVRHHANGPVTGHLTQQWRAVHDFYGHCASLGSFTLRGEMSAYNLHVNDFPRACWPFIWSNVGLENAFRLNRGHFFSDNRQGGSKIVFDLDHFGPQAKWYGLVF